MQRVYKKNNMCRVINQRDMHDCIRVGNEIGTITYNTKNGGDGVVCTRREQVNN